NVTVLNIDTFDVGARVGSRKNQTDFPDVAVENVLPLLLQVVGIDRQHVDVAMLDELLGLLPLLGVVEETVGVDASGPVLEERMSQNVTGSIVLMLPDERDLDLILMLEGPSLDGSTISTQEVMLGSVTAEVRSHFDCSPSFPVLLVAELPASEDSCYEA